MVFPDDPTCMAGRGADRPGQAAMSEKKMPAIVRIWILAVALCVGIMLLLVLVSIAR